MTCTGRIAEPERVRIRAFIVSSFCDWRAHRDIQTRVRDLEAGLLRFDLGAAHFDLLLKTVAAMDGVAELATPSVLDLADVVRAAIFEPSTPTPVQ